VASSFIRDFSILKQLNITIHNPKYPSVKEILWQPPLINWVKCSIDGASKGNIRFFHLVVGFLETMMQISCFVLLSLLVLHLLIMLSSKVL
jgi:hypothetical protein